jgi:hypothetical protein
VTAGLTVKFVQTDGTHKISHTHGSTEVIVNSSMLIDQALKDKFLAEIAVTTLNKRNREEIDHFIFALNSQLKAKCKFEFKQVKLVHFDQQFTLPKDG